MRFNKLLRVVSTLKTPYGLIWKNVGFLRILVHFIVYVRFVLLNSKVARHIHSIHVKNKQHADSNSHIASSFILYMRSEKLHFYQAFLNSTNSIWGKYTQILIQWGFWLWPTLNQDWPWNFRNVNSQGRMNYFEAAVSQLQVNALRAAFSLSESECK